MTRGGLRRFAFRLASHLGIVNVDEMLKDISYPQFLEWRAFESLEPFAEDRADFNSAHIVQAVLRTGKPLRDFMLPFGDSIPPVVQSLDYQTMLIDAWVSTHNASVKR